MTLNQRTIAEIRSYTKPVQEIHTVMQATLVLLGNTVEETKVTLFRKYLIMFHQLFFCVCERGGIARRRYRGLIQDDSDGEERCNKTALLHRLISCHLTHITQAFLHIKYIINVWCDPHREIISFDINPSRNSSYFRCLYGLRSHLKTTPQTTLSICPTFGGYFAKYFKMFIIIFLSNFLRMILEIHDSQ